MIKNDYFCWDCKNFKGHGSECYKGTLKRNTKPVAELKKGAIEKLCRDFKENNYVKGLKVTYGN